MIGLLGKKIGMTQIFDDLGQQVPVTLIELGPCFVSDVKDTEKHGYKAVQLAFDPVREKCSTKARVGHLKKSGLASCRTIREIRTEETDGLKNGQILTVENFEVGDFVDVEGTSIGKGFQGVVKRHHFKGDASKSHGSMFGRQPGSIGASSFPSRVVKGMRAAGHMGASRIKARNLKVVKVDIETNLLAVRGSVPGVEGGYLIVRTGLARGVRRKWKVGGGNSQVSKDLPMKESDPASSESNS